MPQLTPSDQALAISDQIAALSRCGIPLEQGLADLGGRLRGGAGNIAKELSRDLENGKPLVAAMHDHPAFTPFHCAVVEAGIRAGDLPAALQRLATSSRIISGLQRRLRLALIYPASICTLAFGLFVYAVFHVFPQVEAAFSDYTQDSPSWPWIGWLLAYSAWWTWIVPLLGILAFAALWRRGALPGMSKPLKQLRLTTQLAIFLELLAMLLKNRMPLESALPLAAQATGHQGIVQDTELLVAKRQAGSVGRTNESINTLPPCWCGRWSRRMPAGCPSWWSEQGRAINAERRRRDNGVSSICRQSSRSPSAARPRSPT